MRIMEQAPEIEELPSGVKIAYRRIKGSLPMGVVYLNGFMSVMTDDKPVAMQKFCEDHGLSFIRFDYSGVSESPGDIMEIRLSIWFENILHVIDHLTTGPQIVMGSSLGGVFCLLAAEARPERVHACLSISAAVNLSWYASTVKYNASNPNVCYMEGVYDDDIPTKFFDEVSHFDFFERVKFEKLNVKCPVRLIYGGQDQFLPLKYTLDIIESLESDDVILTVKKNSGHALDDPDSIGTLFKILKDLIKDVNLSKYSFE